jgi:CDP-glucose 4,6-dehydratase
MGGWLTRALLELEADVIALVRDETPKSMIVRERWIDRVTVVRGSLLDAPLLRRVLSEYSIETVFHLAAQPLVGVAKKDPIGALETNIQGTWLLLDAARQAGIRQFIFASSDKAYGSSDHLPYRESDRLQGKYPYDVSKSCADLICGAYATTYQLPVAVARCANLFGGGDFNFSRTIPGAIQATWEGMPFQIRSDGKFIRDFLYVKDAARAYLYLAEGLARNPDLRGEAFNFSMELQLTVLDLADRILQLMGRSDLQPEILNQANSEIREQYLDCEKARTGLGWSPRFKLEDGLRETIDWYTAWFEADSRRRTLDVSAAIA